ncbi:putative spermidine/putrescine transport system substrate-binding protein [Nakamurella flavida]|nr:extracellular solute-binding protein [Nakamurella flavida]MDP9779231.1 putative spermidine/putrescine transport system substrate-binding protein [Nakamurella flavida]
MSRSRRTPYGVAALAAASALLLTACGSSTTGSAAATSAATSAAASSMAATTSAASGSAGSSSTTASGSGSAASGDAATATSVADFGGMDGLVAAATAEGALNVIALPPDWANYGEIIQLFQDTYPGITVESQQPDASSAQEIQAAQANQGTDKAPDVFDLGPAVAAENVASFAPYKVATFDSIPEGNKDPDGKWVNDYTGLMTVGYNATKYGEITSLDQLSDPKFADAVALNGNPTEAGAAFNGVVMAALASGGSADDISAGVSWFSKLKESGSFLPLDPTPATVLSGQTGVVFDWSYNQLGYTKALADEDIEWKTFIPSGAALGSYYVQAINADAPHPAAARLWQEFLYSPAAQNLWVKGGAKPVLYDTMVADGTLDQSVAANLPTADGELTTLTPAQTTAANDVLTAQWATAMGS